jgi:hypothetical protein
MINSSVAYFLGHYGITIFVVVLMGFGLWRSHHLKGNRAIDFQFILLAFGGLLASPATATYHALLIVLPAGLLMLHSSADRGWNIFFALLYASIGFLPYSFFMRFEGKGYLSLLAYPRLWILATLFAGSILYIERLLKNELTPAIPRTT